MCTCVYVDTYALFSFADEGSVKYRRRFCFFSSELLTGFTWVIRRSTTHNTNRIAALCLPLPIGPPYWGLSVFTRRIPHRGTLVYRLRLSINVHTNQPSKRCVTHIGDLHTAVCTRAPLIAQHDLFPPYRDFVCLRARSPAKQSQYSREARAKTDSRRD